MLLVCTALDPLSFVCVCVCVCVQSVDMQAGLLSVSARPPLQYEMEPGVGREGGGWGRTGLVPPTSMCGMEL